MNSYYSNRIEGQGTHPLAIAAALRHEYSDRPETARLQRLAMAHIAADRALEGAPTADVLTMAFLQRAHRELYEQLDLADRRSADHTLIVPGSYRTMRVRVGRHVPPEPDAIADFGARFDAVYGKRHVLDQTVLVVAAAHHRASWIHPFEDGNGRAVRLQTHAALWELSNGLWSVSRGLARRSDAYFAHLSAADEHRRGDLDGRGNLSDSALGSWCQWFIDLCADQVTFMESLLRFDDVPRRIHALIATRAAFDAGYRIEVVPALHHLFLAGPTPRDVFLTMTGLGERTARRALAHLIKNGLVSSPSHRGAVRIEFPLDALALLFPDLYPEADTARIDT